MKKLLLSVLVIVGFTVASYAQPNGTASANMQTALSFSQTTPMAFGLLSIPTSESVVSLGASDNRTFVSGTVALIPSATILPKTGVFSIVGQGNAFITVNVDAFINLGENIEVATANNGITQIGPMGTAELLVYGILTIPGSGVTAGQKSGTYTVTVNYL